MKTKYVARMSDNIQSDIKRNWSSWNFGQEGLSATEEQIDTWKEEAIENDQPFCISGFELWGDDIANADIRELYEGYWVLVDNVNAANGISGIALDAENIEQAIEEANNRTDYFGEGVCFDAQEAKLVYSNDDIHIFEIED
jgi:hypothetical protein